MISSLSNRFVTSSLSLHLLFSWGRQIFRTALNHLREKRTVDQLSLWNLSFKSSIHLVGRDRWIYRNIVKHIEACRHWNAKEKYFMNLTTINLCMFINIKRANVHHFVIFLTDISLRFLQNETDWRQCNAVKRQQIYFAQNVSSSFLQFRNEQLSFAVYLWSESAHFLLYCHSVSKGYCRFKHRTLLHSVS